jgi:NAD(P)-dependent dehydrogenase (short-subunit alcohol dehydrogenase family)
MTLPIAQDLALEGIRCVTIASGLSDTPLLASLPKAVRDNLSSTVPCPPRLGQIKKFIHYSKYFIVF